MPKLWQDSIEAHRSAVRDAALDATGALVAEHGLPAVTMSRIAQNTGIGRATLYKYFSDVEAVLAAWHERQVHGHLEVLTQAAAQPGTAVERLQAVLAAYAAATRPHHGNDLAALLHQGEHVTRAQQHLSGMVAGLLAAAADAGDVRSDVAPLELARYCLHALTAAGAVDSDAALQRLVDVTMAGLKVPG